MKESFIVIGGNAAGMSAASKAKRDNPNLKVVVLEKGKWISYGSCGLPYLIKGDVQKIEDLIGFSPEMFRKERGIDVRIHHEVTSINPGGKEIIVKTAKGEEVLSYGKLLISTGAVPLIPKIQGINTEGVFFLKDIESGKRIKEYIQKISPKSVLIVGGGYIGLEMAEAFHAYDMDIHIVETQPHVISNFGSEVAEIVEDQLKKYANLHLSRYVDRIDRDSAGQLIVQIMRNGFHDKKTIVVDMVLVAVGIKPEVSLAIKAGVQIGQTGAIATNQYGQTSDPNIYAAGDCAEVRHLLKKDPIYFPLALTANRNGRSIGRTVGGKLTELVAIAGTAIVKVFQLQVAITGIISQENARENQYDPVKIMINSHSRAGYCPESKPIQITLMADRKSKIILGSSMVGEEGVIKGIDIIASAISGKYTVDQLENLDLAYAPPFSPVWDPVLVSARVLNAKLSMD